MKKIIFIVCILFSSVNVFSQGASCATAVTLTLDGACPSGTISNTAFENPAVSCGTQAQEGWYVFTLGASTNVTITGTNGNRNLALQLISGTCGSPTEIICENTQGAGAGTETISTTLAAGTYYIKVLNVGAGAGLTLNSICVATTPISPDEPCGAIPLVVGSSCTFATYSNAGMTASAGVPAPGCAFYNGGDMWFSAVVPANGSITLDGNTGVILDGGAAIYSGSCGALTLVACDDDSSPDDAMPMINATGLTPGSTVYIRVWEYGGDNNGTFDICVYNPCPPCAGTPTGGSATATVTNLTCASPNTTLSLTGASSGCSYLYQWQSSPNNSTWTNIPGATSATYTTSVSTTTYFRCVITCSGSGLSANSSSVMITTSATPPPNDEPCNAIALTVGSSCNFATYTNACASASAGVVAPGCAFYNGGDVWFTATVPANGNLIFDSNTGVILDGGMAIYSGTCGSLTQIACDDDGSANGAMSYISATGLTPGSTVWIRMWEYGGDNNGTFSVCVYDPCPPCAGAPVGGTATATPNPTSCATPNTTLSLTGSSGGCNISYQWQTSTDNATWSNIAGAIAATHTTSVTTPTYFRCILTCNMSGQSSPSTSVLVTSTIANVCSFTISTPSYSPDASYTAGTLLTFPDDQMSAVIPLGFTFCFMGSTYTNCVVSSNAFISFNTGSAGGYSSWVTVAIPTAVPAETLNSIMFPWHDVDPSVGASSDIRYLTTGVAPNRKFIVNFATVPMFSAACNSQLYTAQVVLNETTNVIETYIQDKPLCPSWNSGNAVHGINGPDGCSGVTVAGRNNTQWTATNDAKMFTPTGCCTVPLSAELTAFTGEQINNLSNRLLWETSSETNLEKFYIEKSSNGNDFVRLVEVNAQGNSSTLTNYSVIDNSPFSRVTYYRLVMKDYDGTLNYSQSIAINNSGWTGFEVLNIFPNPSEGLVNVEILSSEEAEFKLEIKDVSGRYIINSNYALDQGTNIIKLDLTGYEDGIYLFDFINKKTGIVTIMKYVKGK